MPPNARSYTRWQFTKVCHPFITTLGESTVMRRLNKLLYVGISAIAVTSVAATLPSPTYEEALDLVHAYSGSGNELQRAMQLAEGLSKSDPKSGYAQVLYAEALSTWRLDQDGQPTVLRDQIIAMSDEALRLNPSLAQAHVAKARALVRSSMYGQANSSIDAALLIDPTLSGAIFLRAEVFRRIGAVGEADTWYRKFIDSTPSRTRKSNGYYWLGTTYQDAAWNDAANRKALTAKARAAYESMLSLAPDGAWKNVNFAIFLNDYAADFETAERYAQKALGLMEFPMARYHLAAARYQKLGANAVNMQRPAIAKAATQVARSTGVSLADAIAFPSYSTVVRGRLLELEARLPPSQK
jgi:hypothetical protein